MKLAIISSALMILSLSSCKKDFLDLPSETNLSTPVFFKTQEDFEKAVNGEYEPLRTSYARAWVMGEMRSDNTHYFYSIPTAVHCLKQNQSPILSKYLPIVILQRSM